MQNLYKAQYKRARLYCALYMFCISLMMAVLQPKYVALM